jgi:hypothetical protein
MKRTIIIEITAFFYTCLFLYTGIAKLMSYDLSIEQNEVMPIVGPYAHIVSWLLPVIEIMLAIVIFIPKTKVVGLRAGTGLMILFTGYVIYIMNFDSKLPCTCGGFLQKLSWPQHLVFNSVFVVAGIFSILLSRKKDHSGKASPLTYSH